MEKEEIEFITDELYPVYKVCEVCDYSDFSLIVDKETADRWHKVEEEFFKVQREIREVKLAKYGKRRNV